MTAPLTRRQGHIGRLCTHYSLLVLNNNIHSKVLSNKVHVGLEAKSWTSLIEYLPKMALQLNCESEFQVWCMYYATYLLQNVSFKPLNTYFVVQQNKVYKKIYRKLKFHNNHYYYVLTTFVATHGINPFTDYFSYL